jgi:hypothetical protein
VLDRLKRPDVRMSDVRSVLLEVDLAPLKRWQIVEGRTSGRDELELLEHRERGQLHVRSSVRSMSERSERISSILRIQIVPGRDPVLGRERWSAVALRQRVFLEVVVPHQLRHAGDVDHLRMVSLEDESSRGLVVGEPVSVFFDIGRASAHVEDVLEEGSVVARPVALAGQNAGDILGVNVSWMFKIKFKVRILASNCLSESCLNSKLSKVDTLLFWKCTYTFQYEERNNKVFLINHLATVPKPKEVLSY